MSSEHERYRRVLRPLWPAFWMITALTLLYSRLIRHDIKETER